MKRLVALIALAGCDQAFGLERPDPPPPACADLTDHDEDGDRVVDTCDNCPGIANEQQKDERESDVGKVPDGVGDACDPHPQDPGDFIERFHAFDDPTTIDDWEVVSGPWTIANDSMVFDDPDSRSPVHVYQLGAAVPIPGTIEAHVTIRDIESNWAMIGVVANASTQDGEGESCMVYRPFETPDDMDMVKIFHGPNQADSELARELRDGDGYRLTFELTRPSVICRAREDGGASQSTPATLDNPLTPGSLGLLGQGIDATVDYVIVYGVTAAGG